MYISKIRIENYRCFNNIEIDFNDGLNVIMGENNSGKTTILNALGLIFERSTYKKPNIDDFYKGISDFSEPPAITITVIISETKTESDQDKAIVASWLTNFDSPWEATLTYKFFLPESSKNDYQKDMSERPELEARWGILSKYIPKYRSYIFGGNPEDKNKAESEWLDKFDYKYLGALRNVEDEMFTGRTPFLKRMLNKFMDRPVDPDESKQADKVKQANKNFDEKANEILKTIKQRIDIKTLFKLAEKTGAEDGGKLGFDGKITTSDIISVLKLVVNQMGLNVPITSNGLGYNNLVYMSLVLSDILASNEEEMGENAIIFPMLLIEEPEAHLHPALQYRLLKFIDREIKEQKISRQVFITTHSTHITAAVTLDSLICMSLSDKNETQVSYPGKVFSKSNNDTESKKYIERYLDSTKSEMLFAKGIIFVEGIAELLLIPCLAEYILSDDRTLEDYYVSVVAVGGSTFKHFIKLFQENKSLSKVPEGNKIYALNRRVSCLLDTDPGKKEKNNPKARWKECWPFEVGDDIQIYEYKNKSSIITNLQELKNSDNIGIFYKDNGKTLEYDLAFENHDNEIFKSEEAKEQPNLKKCSWDDLDAQTKYAYNYSDNVIRQKKKGENAFNLASNLKNKEIDGFKVPIHIKEAILWACNLKEQVDV